MLLRSSKVWFLKNVSTVSDLSTYAVLSNILSNNLLSLSNFWTKAYGLLVIKIYLKLILLI